jgi:hypothetical protein
MAPRAGGVEHTVIESAELETGERDEEVLIARVRGSRRARRVGAPGARWGPGYDTSARPRRWRGLDPGSTRVFLEATTCRVTCPEHGVGGRCGALGPARVAVHRRVRGHLRVPGLSCRALGGGGAVADRVAQRVPERAHALTHIRADGAEWIHTLAADRSHREQRITLAAIQADKGPLYRAYLLKDVDAPRGTLVGRRE